MREPGDVPFHRLRPGVEQALGKLPNHPNDRPDCIAGLSKFLGDPAPLVRSQAMLSLGRYEGYADRLLPTFDAGMTSDDPRLRAAALIALTGMRPFTPEMLSRVIAMLTDKDRDVRLAVAEGVKRIIPLLKEGEKKRLRAAVERADLGIRERSEGR
jgi:HEAT repeat protein